MPRREYPEFPIVGVGAVVLDCDRVLLVRRGREPLKGEWSLPGGALELGETLRAGICREVAEETGLEIEVVAMIEVLDRIVFDDPAGTGPVRYHYVLVDFLCRFNGGSLVAGTDADDARWVAREELLSSHSFYKPAPATLAVIEKGFAMTKRFRLGNSP